MPRAIRVGAVSYLNAKPLYYRLDERSTSVELSMDLPSRLASRLASGDLDVALIPSVEYLRGAASGYEILPGFAIAARGGRSGASSCSAGFRSTGSTGWRWTRGRGPARR